MGNFASGALLTHRSVNVQPQLETLVTRNAHVALGGSDPEALSRGTLCTPHGQIDRDGKLGALDRQIDILHNTILAFFWLSC